MKDNLRITNLIVTGDLPFKQRLDYKKIIKKSALNWEINNEDMSPILSVRFYRENGINVHKRRKCIYSSIWHSGKINIVGLRSMKEAKETYNKIVDELKKIGFE